VRILQKESIIDPELPKFWWKIVFYS